MLSRATRMVCVGASCDSVGFGGGKGLGLLVVINAHPRVVELTTIVSGYERCFSYVLTRANRGCSCGLGNIFFGSLRLSSPRICVSTIKTSLNRAINGVVDYSCGLVHSVRPSTLLVLNSAGSYLSTVSTGELRVPVFRVRTNGHYGSRYLPRRAGHHVISVVSSIGVTCSRRTEECLTRYKLPGRHACIANSPVTRILRGGLRGVRGDSVLAGLKLRGGGCVLLSTRERRGVSARGGFGDLFSTVGNLTRGCSVPVLCSYRPHSGGHLRRDNFGLSREIVHRRPLKFRSCGGLRVGTFTIISSDKALPRRDDFFASIKGDFPTIYVEASARHPRTLSGKYFILTKVSRGSLLRTISATIRLSGGNFYKVPIPSCASRGISAGIIGVVRSCANMISGVI